MHYCGNCGAKLQKGDAYCGECGTKVEEKKEEPKEERSKTMNPKRKGILLVLVCILVIGGIGYRFLSTMYSPKNVTKKYMNAIVEDDAEAFLKYLPIEKDDTFLPKKKLLETIEGVLDETEIENFTILNTEYEEGSLSADVTVQYTTEKGLSDSKVIIHLTKNKKKFLGLFDQWEIKQNDLDMFIVKDYRVRVPVGSKVSIDQKEIDQKYFSKEDSTEELDVYLLPQVVRAELTIKTTLKNGLELEEKVTPSAQSKYYTAKLSLDTLTTNHSEEIEEMLEKDIEEIYGNLMQGKSWEEWQKEKSSNEEYQELKKKYDSLKEEFDKNSKVSLTSFEVDGITLNQMTNEGINEVKITLKVEYEYEVRGEKKEKTGHFSPSLVYKIDKGQFQLIDINYFVSYFK